MKLLLIGQIYDQAYFCDLKKLIHQLDIEDSVIILNDISFDNLTLVDAYKASDLFVLPSLYKRFGVVVLEAWAAGLPVICSAVGGLTSFVQHDQNGLFCDVRNEKCLAKTIKELMRQPMKRESLKRKAREDVKKYDWQIIGQKLSHIYQTL
jgi:glycosyltransferase involved in cell wall biosynthesis